MAAMSGMIISTETLRITAGDAAIAATIRYPAEETELSPLRFVMICDPLPLAGDSSENLTEAIRDGLLDAGVAVATYESQGREAILDDFDAYSAAQSLSEAVAVWNAASCTGALGESIDTRSCIIGIGIGALITQAALHKIKTTHGVCLVNPVGADSVSSAQLRIKVEDAGRRDLPTAFRNTAAKLDTKTIRPSTGDTMLCLAGAKDAIVNPASGQTIASTARESGWSARSLLVVGGDHAFTDSAARQAAVQEIVEFCTTGPRD